MEAIKANELRIGNWVNHLDHGIFAVDAIFEDGRISMKDWEISNLQWGAIEPIPLTEEWLVKCGFECELTQAGRLWSKGKFQLYEIDDDSIDKYGICLNGMDVYFNHVHTLQNAFYVLTGQELIFNQ